MTLERLTLTVHQTETNMHGFKTDTNPVQHDLTHLAIQINREKTQNNKQVKKFNFSIPFALKHT